MCARSRFDSAHVACERCIEHILATSTHSLSSRVDLQKKKKIARNSSILSFHWTFNFRIWFHGARVSLIQQERFLFFAVFLIWLFPTGPKFSRFHCCCCMHIRTHSDPSMDINSSFVQLLSWSRWRFTFDSLNLFDSLSFRSNSSRERRKLAIFFRTTSTYAGLMIASSLSSPNLH